MNLSLGPSLLLAAALLLPGAASAALNLPAGFNPTDGDLVIAANRTLDLSAAATGRWDTDTTANKTGVYDPEQWAVVYKLSSFTLSSGTLSFTNHPSGCPVIFLVDGDVTINGTISLTGRNIEFIPNNPVQGYMGPNAAPPGGFQGASVYTSGFGPGGGAKEGLGGRGGSYRTLGLDFQGSSTGSTPAYGNPSLFPLIGGSGGGGDTSSSWYTGASGGGAILIFSTGSIAVAGVINATGGSAGSDAGGGSGGAIRLIGTTVTGGGSLYAAGGSYGSARGGGSGGVRIEYVNLVNLALLNTYGNGTDVSQGVFSYFQHPDGASPKVFLDPSTDVMVQALRFVAPGADPTTAIQPQAEISADPIYSLGSLPTNVTLPATGAYDLIVQSRNLPAGWKVSARIVSLNGTTSTSTVSSATAGALISDVGGVQTWRVPVTNLPPQVSAVYVRVDE